MPNLPATLTQSACLLALLFVGCSDPLVPKGDAGWSWRFSVTPETSVNEAGPILKTLLRKAGVKEVKAYPSPPTAKATPGSLVPSELRVEVTGVSEEARELVLRLVTTQGQLRICARGNPIDTNVERAAEVWALLLDLEPLPASLTLLSEQAR